MVAIQEGTYSSTTAKESVCGTACGALLGAIGSWKERLKVPQEQAKCYAQISLISDGQAKQEKKTREIEAGSVHDGSAWEETFNFDLYPSTEKILIQIIEPGKLGSGGTRAECFLELINGEVVDGPEQGCRIINTTDAGSYINHLPLRMVSRSFSERLYVCLHLQLPERGARMS